MSCSLGMPCLNSGEPVSLKPWSEKMIIFVLFQEGFVDRETYSLSSIEATNNVQVVDERAELVECVTSNV